jgi:predicted dehydrogenase
MGTNHLRVLQDLGETRAELIGVAEVDELALSRAVTRFHVPGYLDYRKMVVDTRPDLVVIAAPTHQHAEVAAHAMLNDANVLVEKPIAASRDEAEFLISVAQSRGVKLAVGHVERFNPAIMELKRQLVAGQLGKIFSLHSRRLGPFPPRIRDVGVVLDLATHDIDVMRYLVDSSVRRVFAETQQRVHHTREDLLLGVLRFVNDTVGMLDVNWLTPTKVREISVTGERGAFQVNYLTQELFFFENDYTATNWDALRTLAGVSEGTMTRLKLKKAEPLRLQYEDVLHAVEADVTPTVTGEDGLEALLIAQYLLDAAAAGEVMLVDREVISDPVR